MKAISLNQTKHWLKTSEHPFAKFVFAQLKSMLKFELPAPKFMLRSAYFVYQILTTLLTTMSRILLWTPLFKGRLEKVGKNLNLYGGLPYISGPVRIIINDDCRVSGQSTFTGRSCATVAPVLTLGNNIDIGWMTTIAVGSNVSLGDNVRIAGRAFLAGYPGHPLDPTARALGLPETDDQVGDIIIEQDVWLATGVSVMAGVRIGHGTIVAAGSVVTHDLPAMVLAGGVPARVIRTLTTSDKSDAVEEK
ncbi:acetyltransferase [Psychromonas marina]|uniref:Acetyltransferase n=1 Tax=Psychromonas marina TaxID=88364 RepID=A0ABQ6E1T2_9GAMM|nr:acyltransferase [Psychromonas marina]GLS91285.1 acetyltransferase [Psychromonas marina]